MATITSLVTRIAQDIKSLRARVTATEGAPTGWRDITADFTAKTDTTSGLLVLWRARGDLCEIRARVSITATHTSWQLTTDGSGARSYTPWLPGGVASGVHQVLGSYVSSQPLTHGPARLWGTSLGIGTTASPSLPAGTTILAHLWWRRPATDPGTLPGQSTTSTL